MYQTTTPLELVAADGGGSGGGGYRAQGAKSGCGEDYQHEKNWIAFADGEALRYVYAVSSHVVKTQDAQGHCSVRETYTDVSDLPMSLALAELKEISADDVGLHGSGSAVDWDDGSRLALFHTKDADDAYVTYAYTMQAAPPYGVIAVSRPLPLAGANGAFASSLAIPPGGDKVVVAYGLADADSRALVMSKAHLSSLFRWAPFCGYLSNLTATAPTYRLLRSYSSCRAEHVSLGLQPTAAACSAACHAAIEPSCAFFSYGRGSCRASVSASVSP